MNVNDELVAQTERARIVAYVLRQIKRPGLEAAEALAAEIDRGDHLGKTLDA